MIKLTVGDGQTNRQTYDRRTDCLSAFQLLLRSSVSISIPLSVHLSFHISVNFFSLALSFDKHLINIPLLRQRFEISNQVEGKARF